MSASVTSIASARASARRQSERAHANSRVAITLLVVTGLLLVIGLGATLSASSVVGLDRAQDRFYYFKRQLLGVGIGTVAMVAAARVPHQWYRKAAGMLYVGAAALLAAVLVVGEQANGATRWLAVGSFTIQPSELAKPVVIIALASVLLRKERRISDGWHFLIPVGATVGLIGALVMLEPDLGTALVIAAASMGVLVASAAPFRHVAAAGGIALSLAALLAVAEPYRFERLRAFLDPWNDSLDTGYQLIQSYTALGTGGVLGVGLGASRARWFFLPNAHTDFIFAIVGEETGLVGGLAILVLFALLTTAGVVVARRARDRFGRMVAMGITTWLSVQALINVGGVVGALPITGITLPFMSFGGTALVTAMGAVGVLVNVAGQGGPGRR